MAEVRLGETLSIIGLSIRLSIFSTICLCFVVSRNDLFGCLVILPERSFELAKERLNMLDEERDRNERRKAEKRVGRLV